MKRFTTIVFICLVVIISNYANAQGPPPPDGGGGPGTVNDVPINFLVYPFLVFGAYLGYVFFRKPFK